MGIVDNRFSFSRPTMGGLVKGHSHTATNLKNVMAEGKVLLYDDGKHAAEKMEILAPEGRVVITKDYEVDPKAAKFNQIQVFSTQDELVDTINIIEEGSALTHHSTFRFHYGNSPIGRGDGDIAMYIAQKVLGDNILDPRYVAEAHVDEEVITTLMRMLHRKTV